MGAASATPKGGRRLPFRLALLIGAMFVTLPSFVLLGVQTLDRARHEAADVESAARDRAERVALDTARVLDEARRVLEGFAARPSVVAADPRRCDQDLSSWSPTDAEFGRIVVYGRDGSAACRSSSGTRTSPPTDPGADAWFAEALAGDVVVVAGPMAAADDAWMAIVARDLGRPGGPPSGVIALSIHLDRFGPLVGSVELADAESLTLVNAAGRVLLRVPTDPATVTGTDIRDTDVGRLVLSGDGTVATVVGLDGTRRVFGVAAVPDSDWRVSAGIPSSRVDAVWSMALAEGIVLALLSAVFAAAIATVVGLPMVRSARALGRAADAFAAGAAPTGLPEMPFTEAAHLVDRFAHMAARRNELEAALRVRERDLQEAQRIAGIGSWTWNPAANTIAWSDEAHELLGLAPGQLPQTEAEFVAWVHPDDRHLIAAADDAVLHRGEPYEAVHRFVLPSGETRWLHERGALVEADDVGPRRVVGTTQEVTAQVHGDADRSRLASAVEQSADAVMIVTPESAILYVNPAFERLYGYAPGEVVGRDPHLLSSGRHDAAMFEDMRERVRAGRSWTGSIINRRADGALVEVESVISPVLGPTGRVTAFVQSDRDVTRERQLEAAIARDARERETIRLALERLDPDSTPEGIASIACAEIARLEDVATVTAIELTAAGGRFLAVAGRLATSFGPGDPLPTSRAAYLRERAGGGPWVETWRSRREDGRYGERLRAAGLRRVAYAPVRGPGGVLVGLLAIGEFDGDDADRLVERLPALVTFGSVLGAVIAPRLAERQHAEDDRAAIRSVLDAAAFSPFFQPIADLRSGRVVGFEALTRFRDGTRPDLMFEQAARAGLGIELEVATMAAAVSASTRLPGGAYLSLNASPALILSGRLAAVLRGIERTVVLEVTEHAAIADYVALRLAIDSLGERVELAVDDAGAGYASLLHTLELEPDIIKLDLTLVRGVGTDPARQALIAGIGYFATKRRIRLLAEGIETRAELAAVRDLAVPYGQGFLLGKPRDALDEVTAWPETIEIAVAPPDRTSERISRGR